jgi:hypothetical protein
MATLSKSRQPTLRERLALYLIPWERGGCALHSLSGRVSTSLALLAGTLLLVTGCESFSGPAPKSLAGAQASDAQTGRRTIVEAFAQGISDLAKEHLPCDRGEYKITIEPTETGWAMRYLDAAGDVQWQRLVKDPSAVSMSTTTTQPDSSGIKEAFELGIVELAKDGLPFKHGEYSLSIKPSGLGWEMRYLMIPRKMSGDRLLFIQNRYVQVVPLF